MTSVQDAAPNNKTVNGSDEHAGESLDEPNRQTLKTEDPTPTFTSGDVTLKDDTTNDVSPIVITPTDVSENDVIPPSFTLTPQTPDGAGDAVVKRKRGRPPKPKSSESQPMRPVIPAVVQASVSSPTGDSAVKRKRGRPPKRPLDSTDHHSGVGSTEGESDNMSSCEMTPPVKRGRGRPRKSESQKVKYKEVLSLSSMSSPQRTGQGSAVGTPSSEARISRRLAVKRESGYVAPWKSLMKSPKEEDDDETESVERRKRGRPRLDSNTPIRKIVQPQKSTGSQRTGDVISKDARRIHSIMKKPVDTTEEGKNTKAFGQTVACVSKAVVDKLTTDHHLPRLFNQLTNTLSIAWFSSEDLTYYLHGDINALCQAQQVLDKVCEGQTLADSCASLNISFVETVDEPQEDGKEDDNGEVEVEGAEVKGPESEDSQTEDPAQTTDHEDHEYVPPEAENEVEEEEEEEQQEPPQQEEEKLVMINPTTGEPYRRVCAIYTNPEMANVACDVCNFVTTEKGLLKHRMRKHPELVFECEICLEKFGVRYDMRRHRLKHFQSNGVLKQSFEYSFRQRYPQVTGRITLGVLEEHFKPDGTLEEEEGAEVKPKKGQEEGGQAESAEGGGEKGEGQGGDEETKTKSEDTEPSKPEKIRSMKDIQKIHLCDECDYQGSVTGLNKHKSTSHPRYLYKCPKCPFVLGDLIDFLKHYSKHDESTETVQQINIEDLGEFCVCIMCGEQGTEEVIREHVDTKHPRQNVCRHCDVTLPSQRTLQNHFRTAHRHLYRFLPRPKKSTLQLPKDVSRCPCEVCGKSIRQAWYHQHMKTHNRVTLRCDFCGFETWKRFEMKNHLLIKHGPKQFMCHVCGQTFSYKSAHLSHMKNKHSDTPAIYPCPHCDKTFSVKRFMLTHVKRIHLKEKKFFCDICGRGFFEKIRMKQHREVHQSLEVRQASKQFKCSNCDRSFRDRAKLTQHQNVHTGERPFKCKLCDKGFAWKAELTKHEVSKHTEDRPHRCNLCHKAFKFRYKLTAHMITHTRQSPHMCQACGKAFTQSATLKKHRCRLDVYTLPQQHISQGVSHNLVQIQKEPGQTEEIYIQVEDPESSATVMSSDNLAELVAAQTQAEDDSVTFMCGMCEQLFSTVTAINEHVVNEHGESVTLVVESDSTEQLMTEAQDQGAALTEIHMEQVGTEQEEESGELVQEEQQGHDQLQVAVGETDEQLEQHVLVIQPNEDEQVVALQSAMEEQQEVVVQQAQILTQEELGEGTQSAMEEQQEVVVQQAQILTQEELEERTQSAMEEQQEVVVQQAQILTQEELEERTQSAMEEQQEVVVQQAQILTQEELEERTQSAMEEQQEVVVQQTQILTQEEGTVDEEEQTMAIQVIDLGANEQHMSDSQQEGEQVTVQLSALDPTQQVTIIETQPADSIVE